MGPCHSGMERPRVADGGDGLEIWNVATVVLNNIRGRPTRGGLPDLGWARS